MGKIVRRTLLKPFLQKKGVTEQMILNISHNFHFLIRTMWKLS